MRINLNVKKAVDFYIGGLGLFLIYFPVRLVGLLLRRDHDLTKPQHIVFIKLLGGGSLLMTQPLIFHLRKKYPSTQISLICGQSISGFARAYNLFNEVRIIDDHGLVSFLKSGLENLLWLFRTADISIDLEIHSRITTLYTTLALVKNRIGLVDHQSLWRKRIYTHSVYVNSIQNIPQVYDSLWALFGGTRISLKEAQDQFFENLKSVTLPDFSGTALKRVGVGLGCSDLAYERQMTIQDWSDLVLQIATRAQDPQGEFVFLGGPADHELAEKVIREVAAKSPVRCENLCGRLTLPESLKVLSTCQVFLAIDSALIHLARYLRVPSVSFWGPTGPTALLRPLHLREKFFYNRILCSPCVHFTEDPPCGGKNICMQHKGSFAEVVEWVINILDGHGVGRAPLSPQLTAGGVLTYFPLEILPRRLEMAYEVEE